jgi:AP-4 complex subunit mu-1
MYFAIMTRQNISPSVGVEMATRVSQLIKDYCGVLTEEAIRKNISLIYELLDEIIDYGYPQNTSTEQLKAHVLDEPILVSKSLGTQSFSNTAHSSSANKSVLLSEPSGNKNETFVDLFEQLTVLFNPSGQLIRADLDGQVKLRCYVPGSPLFHMGFNEDLVVRTEGGQRPSGIVFDDVVFHKSVNLDRWTQDRSITFHPPEGEFAVMNYRMDVVNLPMPFKISTRFSMVASQLADLIITVEAMLPDQFYGSGIVIKCPLAQATTSASFSFDVDDDEYERAEFSKADKCVIWTISKLRAGFTAVCHVKMVLETPLQPHFRREFGPVSMTFEAPMLLLSSLQVKFLRVSERNHTFTPERWIRAATTSTSYVARLDLTK